jgi:hypothetical protein
MKQILKKRSRKFEKFMTIQYFVKWKNYNSEHNSWVFEKNCENSLILIVEFESRSRS